MALGLMHHYHDYILAKYCLVVMSCSGMQDIYKKEEKRGLFQAIGVQGLKNASQYIYKIIGGTNPDQFWKNRLHKIIQVWPKDKLYQDEAISKFWSLTLIQLSNYFGEAFKEIEFVLCPLNQGNKEYFIKKLHKRIDILFTQFPITVFDLIFKTTNPLETSLNEGFQRCLQDVITQLLVHSPDLQKDERYNQLVKKGVYRSRN